MSLVKNDFILYGFTFFLLVSLSQGAEYVSPETSFGHPDLQGTYTFRTLTPMQRPA